MAADDTEASLAIHFDSTVKPFLQTYCVTCHGREKPEADLNLAAYSSIGVVAKNGDRLGLIVERLAAEEMPPRKAKIFPAPAARRQAIEWFQSLRDFETLRNAGDPGVVLARRLSNAEYDYTIRDLTGVDIKPTREFPADPSNMAGFDNSGESLVMSPSLLNKYLAAAREVASHMFLKPSGFAFAPYPMLVETDRDKFCVQQIIDLYHRQNIDYADYFQAAWRFKNRSTLGQPSATLAEMAAENKVSAKYLATIWSTLAGAKADAGPLVKLQSLWIALPVPDAGNLEIARQGCEDMRAYVIAVR